MSLDPSADEPTYGELLGEYFTVVAKIGHILDDFGMPRAAHKDRYDRLSDQKAALRERLAEMERDQDQTDVESILEQALKSA